jgi:hypothetical protein
MSTANYQLPTANYQQNWDGRGAIGGQQRVAGAHQETRAMIALTSRPMRRSTACAVRSFLDEPAGAAGVCAAGTAHRP